MAGGRTCRQAYGFCCKRQNCTPRRFGRRGDLQTKGCREKKVQIARPAGQRGVSCQECRRLSSVKLADGSAPLGQLVDAHDVLLGWFCIDVVRFDQVYVPGAFTVVDKRDPVWGAVTPFQPIVSDGQQGSGSCSGLRAHGMLAPRLGTLAGATTASPANENKTAPEHRAKGAACSAQSAEP
eukprot:1368839-Pleurochrysis_carterae.AAC.7